MCIIQSSKYMFHNMRWHRGVTYKSLYKSYARHISWRGEIVEKRVNEFNLVPVRMRQAELVVAVSEYETSFLARAISSSMLHV